jgi:hypothetical protein
MNYIDEKFEDFFDYLNADGIVQNIIVFGSLFAGIFIVGLWS